LLERGGKHYFVGNGHHIIADAVTARIFTADLMMAYAALRRDPNGLAPQTYSYADCIAALHASHTIERRQAARAYWRAFLSDAPTTVAFPRKQGAPAEDCTSESIYFESSESTTSALRGFARENGTTLFIVLSAIYGALLSKHAHQDVVVMSYPVNMRPPGHGHVFGCFVNLSLQKVIVGAGTTFRALVAQVTQQRAAARPHLFYPLGELVHEQGDVRADLESSYFGVFFGETHLYSSPISLGDLRAEAVVLPWSQEFDRDLRLLYDAQDPKRIRFRMDFRSTRYERAAIASFIDDFTQLSERVIVDDLPLREIF
jgi:hypothetical protein